MGRDVVPLILADLRKEPYQWFWALRAITGEDPCRRPTPDRAVTVEVFVKAFAALVTYRPTVNNKRMASIGSLCWPKKSVSRTLRDSSLMVDGRASWGTTWISNTTLQEWRVLSTVALFRF
jgi:hypothetical protein